MRLGTSGATEKSKECTSKSKRDALLDWRLVFYVWSFITPGASWGEDILLDGAVCVTIVVDSGVPKISKLARYLVCIEPRANKRRGCMLCRCLYIGC